MKYTFPILLLLTLYASKLCALPSDAEQDLFLEAETLEYDEKAGTIVYSGNVKMSQGSMLIEADKLVIYGNAERATKVTAIGKPALFEQTPEIGASPVKARANELIYKVGDKWLLLQGEAFLDQDGTSLSSSRIEYDVNKALVKASSGKNQNKQNRVRMVIPPKALEAEDE
jgi:lipopolysaccharide export system protein LptA